jgi:hypothetical protein
VALDPEQPGRDRFGRLRWLGSLHLTSPDSRFGGYSGLELVGDELLAVSDTGHWIAFRPLRDANGRLAGVTGGRISALLDTQGKPLRGKLAGDAEALRRRPDGGLLVSFERDHRVWHYPAAFAGRATPFATPDALRRLPANGGIEALAAWDDGAVLLLAEDSGGPPLAKPAAVPAWLGHGGAWRELAYAPGEGFSPTDAAVLASGDLVVLERRYQPLAGPSARLVKIARAAIQPGARLAGDLLAELLPPLAVDNLEGLALAPGGLGPPNLAARAPEAPGPDGGTSPPRSSARAPAAPGGALIYAISDDNVSPFQRTLLILFRFDP